MRKSDLGFVVVIAALVGSCAPKLEAPHESLRITGKLVEVSSKPDASETPEPEATPETTKTPVPGHPAKSGKLKSYPVLHQMPLGVAVYEACSSQLYFFKKCPGTFLGEAKLVTPGKFVVEVDTEAPEVVVFGFRGFLGPEQEQEACAELKIAVKELDKPIRLKLEPGTCSIKLERRYG